MSALSKIGWCCLILSIWAIIQLSLMGFFYRIESFTLLEDVHPEEYKNTEDALKKTKIAYKAVSRNCWIAAGMYGVMFLLSLACLFKDRRNRKRAILMSEDEPFCNPEVRIKMKASKAPKAPKAPKEKTRKA